MTRFRLNFYCTVRAEALSISLYNISPWVGLVYKDVVLVATYFHLQIFSRDCLSVCPIKQNIYNINTNGWNLNRTVHVLSSIPGLLQVNTFVKRVSALVAFCNFTLLCLSVPTSSVAMVTFKKWKDVIHGTLSKHLQHNCDSTFPIKMPNNHTFTWYHTNLVHNIDIMMHYMRWYETSLSIHTRLTKPLLSSIKIIQRTQHRRTQSTRYTRLSTARLCCKKCGKTCDRVYFDPMKSLSFSRKLT